MFNLKSLGILFCIVLFALTSRAADFPGVRALVQRRVPWLDKHLILKKVSFSKDQLEKKQGTSGKEPGATRDAFTLRSVNGKILVEASTASAAAFGVHWYLKYYCHRSMSHMGDQLAPVDHLPVLAQPVHMDAFATYRYALNYCTYNYTMSFYNLKDWERELDWMALNGVNLMLVANGQEAVWQDVLEKLGYTAAEIQAFITGPAYNAWWLMGNIQGWGGPMTKAEIASRSGLTRKMLERMKLLGIEPVMPAFYGMVPSSLKNKVKANIVDQGTWGYFTRPDILDPSDSLFQVMGKLFYDATKKLYGKDLHFFSGDPFHEGGKHGNIQLRAAGNKIQSTMQAAFAGAVWVLQGWQSNPDKELIAGVNKKDLLIQELFGENTHNWETRGGYEGTPFIWCTVTNFGERPGINGKLQRFADEVDRIRKGPYAGLCKGVGIMPEGIDNNPVVYELLLELGWHQNKVEVRDWIRDFILARYGKVSDQVAAAWQLLLKSAYSSDLGYAEGPPENILCARPALQLKSVSSWGRLAKKYNLQTYLKAVDLFVSAWPDFSDLQTYRIDLISLLMQQIGSDADSLHAAIAAAYAKKNLMLFREKSESFLRLFDLADKILSTDPFYRLSTYLKQAQDLDGRKGIRENNVHNLIMLNTYWGGNDPKEDNLHEYAYKEWAPLMVDFYKARWSLYLGSLEAVLEGKPAQHIDFFHWERDWVKNELPSLYQKVKVEPARPEDLTKLLPKVMAVLRQN